MLEVSIKMAEINTKMAEVMKDTLANNRLITAFNTTCIQENVAFLESGLGASFATPESNAILIFSNSTRIAEIKARTLENKLKLKQSFIAAEVMDTLIQTHADSITEQRIAIKVCFCVNRI